jgi:hypothetical protein
MFMQESLPRAGVATGAEERLEERLGRRREEPSTECERAVAQFALLVLCNRSHGRLRLLRELLTQLIESGSQYGNIVMFTKDIRERC